LNDGTLVRKLREAGLVVHVIPESQHSLPRIVMKAAGLVRADRLDVIHTHRYKENLIGFLLARALRVRRRMTTVHGFPESSGEGRRERGRESFRVRGNYLLLRYGFTQIVAVSEEMKRALTERFRIRPEKVRVIYNGVVPGSASGREGETSREGFHIGTVGRLVPIKDFDLFLRLAAELRNRLPHVRLSILGDGPLKGTLQETARALNVADVVEFLPLCLDARPFYRSLDLYVNTSIHEGIPLSLLEAMACETPVVAPKVGGIPEIVTHEREGLLPENRSPASFADACVRILSDEPLRRKMGRAARQRVLEAFSDERMANSYCSSYLG
jgi:L-malate glycosyltransferase